MIKIKQLIWPFILGFCLISPVHAQEEIEGEKESHEESNRPIYRLGSQRTWPFFSFLNDPGDDAKTLGLEFESYINVGPYNVKNISYNNCTPGNNLEYTS